MELEGDAGRVLAAFAASTLRSNSSGTWAQAQKPRAAFSIRRTGKGSVIGLKVSGAQVSRLLGGAIVVRVSLGEHSGATQMTCEAGPRGVSCASNL
jgi:hypothetical protein